MVTGQAQEGACPGVGVSPGRWTLHTQGKAPQAAQVMDVPAANCDLYLNNKVLKTWSSNYGPSHGVPVYTRRPAALHSQSKNSIFCFTTGLAAAAPRVRLLPERMNQSAFLISPPGLAHRRHARMHLTTNTPPRADTSVRTLEDAADPSPLGFCTCQTSQTTQAHSSKSQSFISV